LGKFHVGVYKFSTKLCKEQVHEVKRSSRHTFSCWCTAANSRL